MATYVNPLDRQAFYRQQKLGTLLSGQGIHPDVAVGGPQPVEDNQANRQSMAQQGLNMLSQSDSNRTDLYRQAVQRKAQMEEEARQRAFFSQQMSPTGRGGPTTGGLVGPYKLAPSAWASLNGLMTAYQQRWGQALPINSGGRTHEEQQHLYDLYRAGRGNLAARPGTSVHESGRAVDFGGPIQNASSAQHAWLVQNASRWGWQWTGKNFSQFEPWHFEYTG